ncbi:Hypothetical predicted protein, partial [Paramuricea clavata]
MDDEIEALEGNETFELVPPPKGREQAIQNNMLVHQMDVKTAYLNAPIDCEIFIEQPKGYERSVKDSLSNKFRMKDLGVLSWFLGTEFKCSEGAIEMSQKQYIEKLLLRAILIAEKHVLRYLKGTIEQRLRFRKSESTLKLIGFCDSDWGGDLLDVGPLVSWRSRKQPTVALSTCEAEYIALTDAVQEAKFLTQLCVDLKVVQVSYSVLVNGDNQGAINLAKNPMYHKRSKHIDVKYHFIRSEVRTGSIVLAYIPTDENVADIFTKPVSKVKLDKFGLFMS